MVSSRATRRPDIEVSRIAAKALMRRGVDEVQDAEAAAKRELVVDEVERPARAAANRTSAAPTE